MDTLGVKELYSLKHETGNRALNAKMLSSLYAKPTSLAVQVGREVGGGVGGAADGWQGLAEECRWGRRGKAGVQVGWEGMLTERHMLDGKGGARAQVGALLAAGVHVGRKGERKWLVCSSEPAP